ncbi:SDR family NAD(P)-dependent oxidoreductase, partial [Staphylococcus epidermidis]
GSRNEERGQQASKELGVDYVQLDVSDDKSVQQAFETISNKEGRVDVLINNAGISGGFAKVADFTAKDVEKVYNTNVFGIVRMMNTFIPLLE